MNADNILTSDSKTIQHQQEQVAPPEYVQRHLLMLPLFEAVKLPFVTLCEHCKQPVSNIGRVPHPEEEFHFQCHQCKKTQLTWPQWCQLSTPNFKWYKPLVNTHEKLYHQLPFSLRQLIEILAHMIIHQRSFRITLSYLQLKQPDPSYLKAIYEWTMVAAQCVAPRNSVYNLCATVMA